VTRDIWTMVWKEWREFRDQLLSLRRGGLSALILALILGVVAPVQLGPEWVHSKIIIGYWPFLAATMVSSLIADSVAGERERHTLETLLASRLPDAAILIGKIVAAVLYGLGFAVANMLIGLIAVNVAHRESAPILFGAQRFVVTIILTVLASLLMAGIGVFISLRASTVKQAQQTFGIAIIVLTMGPLLLFNALEAAGTIVWATIKQRHVPGSMLGRVSSLDWLVSIALMPLSFALTAPVAALVGVRATLIGAAVLGAAVTLGAYFLPGMTAIEQRHARGRGSWQVPVDVTD